MTWQELEALFQEKTKAIWLNEPEDLERLRNGIIDSGAGSYGQVFTTLLFLSTSTVASASVPMTWMSSAGFMLSNSSPIR